MNRKYLHTAPQVLAILFICTALITCCAPIDIKTRRGVYHTVNKGESLWRICYAYNVNMESVRRFNGIRDSEHIVVGERLFIPGVLKVRKVILPAPKKGANTGFSAKQSFRPSKKVKRNPPSKKNHVNKRIFKKTKAPVTDLNFSWPVKGPVTSWFGIRKGRRHDGIDIAAPKSTPIYAAERGKIIYSGNGISGYGNLIIIKHRDGFNTVYAHNSINHVKIDETVVKRQLIGKVGNTGRARGYHLHFEIRRNVSSVDPMKYLP